MGVELVPEADPAEREAVTRAIAAAAGAKSGVSPWWRAGLDEAVRRAMSGPARPPDYDAARSPRRTRGATRA